ncbi:MAG: hypothetical protein ACM3QU_09380 [Verrucomicrobiota bacterium]
MSSRSTGIGRFRLAVVVGLVFAGAGVSTAPAATPGATLDPAPSPGTWSAASPGPFARSALLERTLRPTTAGRIGRGAWWGGPVVTSTGETVTIYVSDRFNQDESIRLSWANFFAWLYHGPELSRVTIYQAPLEEVQQLCGPEAAGCYSPSRQILVFPGDAGVGADADIGAHEYGHHIAANRRNDPWDANDWGPKRWATLVGVCTRVAAGTAFPGDEGDHYTLNTGEAFAEAYRFLNLQRGGTWANFPLLVDPSFTPTPESLASALSDVQQPWMVPESTSWDGQFAAPVVNLNAAVGPGAAISLKTAAGAPVRALGTGTFAIAVRDLSTKDNFHLLGGAGLDRRTSVAARGRVLWRLVLKAGTYRYRSDAHPLLGGSFTVGAAANRATALPPREKSITTLLDGSFLAAATGTANTTLELIDPASGQDLVGATADSVSFSICGHRSVRLRVAATQPGTFHVAISAP